MRRSRLHCEGRRHAGIVVASHSLLTTAPPFAQATSVVKQSLGAEECQAGRAVRNGAAVRGKRVARISHAAHRDPRVYVDHSGRLGWSGNAKAIRTFG